MSKKEMLNNKKPGTLAVLGRLLRYMFKYYKGALIAVFVCITINAMAFNQTGLVDPFHGREDLQNGVIRCVGNPDDRFNEDALRILRALRFSSTYGFSIEEKTSQSIHKNRELLMNIAAERIRSELCKMLYGKGILNVLLEYSDVIATIIPEFKPCIGFDQNNRFHEYIQSAI